MDYCCEFNLNDGTTELLLGRPEPADENAEYGLDTVTNQWKQTEAATGKNIVAGFNSDMYIMETGEPTGVVIRDGELIHENYAVPPWNQTVILHRSFFAITKEGDPVIVNGLDACYDKETDTHIPVDVDKYQLAVSGDIIILDGDMVFCKDSSVSTISSRLMRHSRTAVGIKDDGSIVLFATSGYITPWNYGYTNQQVALIMKAKGCHTALMLDGAGSTTYVSQYANESEPTCRNYPGDGAEREICTSLLIATKASTAQIKAASQKLSECETEGHTYLYKSGKITCQKCDFATKVDEFSGLVQDAETGKYRMLYNGESITGYVPFGLDEVFYFDQEGLSCPVTILEDVASTCMSRGYRKYFCEAAPAKSQTYQAQGSPAPGHDYNKENICVDCGWERVDIDDCKITVEPIGYTGEKTTPSVTITTPNGKTMTAEDYDMTVEERVELGSGTISFTPKSTYYINLMEDRGSFTGTRTVTYRILPYPATNLTQKNTDYQSLDLTWTASKSEDANCQVIYDIYQKLDGQWKRIDSTNKTEYSISNLKSGSTYQFKVLATAKGEAGKTYESWASAFGTVRTLSVLATPKVKAGNVAETGKVSLSWEEIPGASAYKIYRSTERDGKYIYMNTVTGTYYVNKTSKSGKLYYYKVKAILEENAAGNSLFSSPVKRTCDLARPTVTAANDKKTGKPKLTWKRINGAEKYKIYRATAKNGKYIYMNTVTGNTYVNKTAKKGKTYWYKVKAIDTDTANANSSFSFIVKRKCR